MDELGGLDGLGLLFLHCQWVWRSGVLWFGTAYRVSLGVW